MATFNYSEGSYWCNNGKHQELFDSIYENYIPKRGQAHESVELLRLINGVCHDVYNNGGGNLIDMGTSAYARYLVELAPKQGVSLGYVGEKLEKVWERNEELDELYSEGEITCDEHINEHADFDEDNKFLQELELLMDAIVLHCDERIKEADQTFWKTYGASNY
jgi:type I restriction-modification system DNA methylase subunit